MKGRRKVTERVKMINNTGNLRDEVTPIDLIRFFNLFHRYYICDVHVLRNSGEGKANMLF